MLNDSGMIVTSHEYMPFGEDWVTEGDTKNAPKYNSQELDKESGYYFYNARHYDPEIARFVTADTVVDGELSTQGWNRFAYVHNNPIRYKDPTGHWNIESTLKGTGPGHEYLTLTAVQESNFIKNKLPHEDVELQEYFKLGSQDNDYPTNPFSKYLVGDTLFGLYERHASPSGQSDHFMKRSKNQSVKDAINEGLDKINAYANDAMMAAKEGDSKKEAFYLGKAMHTLQDSFAPSHVERDKKTGDIKDIYHYGSQDNHNKYSDAIFKEGPGAREGTLTKLANRAKNASTDFLNAYCKAKTDGNNFDIKNTGLNERYFSTN